MKKKVLVTMLSASLVCAAAAITFAACGDTLYDVTYAKGGEAVTGTLPTEGQHKKGDKFKLKESELVYDGYEFDGWSYNDKTYAEGEEFTMPGSNVTFTAKWAQLVTVTYEWDGGAKPDGAAEDAELPGVNGVEKVKVNTKLTLPTLEAKENYTFSGWKVKTSGLMATSPYTVTSDITFQAVFVKSGFFMVNYSFGTGENNHAAQSAKLPNSKEVTKGSTVTLEAAPAAAAGWAFDGWEVRKATDNAPVEVTENTFTMPTDNVNITAKWVQTFTVTYAWDNAENRLPQDMTSETKLPDPAQNVKSGTDITLPTLQGKGDYQFKGWKDESGYIIPIPEEGEYTYTVTADVTLKAVFGREGYYWVNYSLGAHAADGATTPASVEYAKTSEVTLETAPAAATGWKFKAWEVKDADGETVPVEDGKFTMPEKDVTVTATWTQLYKVTYVLGEHAAENATAPEEAWYEPEETVTVSATTPAAADGWQFDKWTVSENATVDAGSFTMPASDVTITATWKQLFTLTYELYDGTWAEGDGPETTYADGSEIQLPAAAAVTAPAGLTLLGWKAGDTEYAPGGDYTVNDNATVTAVLGKKIDETYTYATGKDFWGTPKAYVAIQYGQKVTITADVTISGTPAFWMGVFAYLADKDNPMTINSHLRWDWWVMDYNDSGAAAQTAYPDLGVAIAKNVVMTNNGTAVENTQENLVARMSNITNFTLTADYTTEGTIVTTIYFTSSANDINYTYTGKLTYTALDLHVGLKQEYNFGIGGEAATSSNMKFVVEGKTKTITTPPASHDWTQENGYKCTVCGQINPEHPHDYVEDVCTICGELNPNHTFHKYPAGGGLCTICGNYYQVTSGGTTYTGALRFTDLADNNYQVTGGDKTYAGGLTFTELKNNDPDGGWWNGNTANVEIDMSADKAIYVISWDKTRDPHYYDVRLDIANAEGKDMNDPWVKGVYRLSPVLCGNGKYFEGSFTKDEEAQITGNLITEGDGSNSSVGSYKAFFIKLGDKAIYGMHCTNGDAVWTLSVTIDLTDTNLPNDTLYFRVAGNPTFIDNVKQASAKLTEVVED